MSDSLPMPITAPLSNAQRTQLLNLVRRAAKAEIMPRFRLLDTHHIDTKTGPEDLVTIADKAAEAMITRGILTMFPNALIVGEEHASANPEIMDKIAEAELCFTIDPVDGTWNYAKGLTCFGVMVSILRFGNPVFGLLYDPVMNDVIWADDQSPAMMIGRRGFKRKLSTSKGGPVEKLTGYVPLSLVSEDKRSEMVATYPRFERVSSLRCMMQEMRMLTQGNVDFVLTAKLTPWDQPAGVVTARQAGAHVAMLDGSDYNGAKREGYMLAACNVETWGRVRDMFDFLIDKPVEEAKAEVAEEETRDSGDA